jgi:hypothetical protein
MRESLQEQLERLAKSGQLPTNTTKPLQQSAPDRPRAIARDAGPYGNLIRELEELRASKEKLTNEMSDMTTRHEDKLSALRIERDAAIERQKSTKESNDVLTQENLSLNNKLAAMPDEETVGHWRAKSIEAAAQQRQNDQWAAKLHSDSLQLASDREVFEKDLVRLESLDAAAAELASDQKIFAKSNEEFQKRLADLERAEKKVSAERSRLEKLSNQLAELQARVGHLKGIERTLKALEADHEKLLRSHEASKTRIRNLKAKKENAEREKAAADASAKQLGRELKTALDKLAKAPKGEITIQSWNTVQWMVDQFHDPLERLVPKKILLIGDGPWQMDAFTGLLQGLGFEVWQDGSSADIEVVVVGRENWSEAVIDAQIEARDGDLLRIYPQELFVLLLAMQADPLELADSEALLKFADGHSVFEYLLNQEFPWPDSNFDEGPPTTIGLGFDGEDASSPLYKMGYTVAQQIDLRPTQRRDVLAKAYDAVSLPWCISEEYMADWGEESSRRRLRRIAWHLHLMSKRFRRHAEAVARWEADLDWLKRAYYKPIQRFRWPT